MRFCRAVRPLLADNRSCKAQKRVNVDNRASLERKLHYELYQLWTMLISTALLCEAGSYGAPSGFDILPFAGEVPRWRSAVDVSRAPAVVRK